MKVFDMNKYARRSKRKQVVAALSCRFCSTHIGGSTANNKSTPSSKRLRTSTNYVKPSKKKTLLQVQDSNCNLSVANMNNNNNSNTVTPKLQITKQRLSEPGVYTVGGKLIQQENINEYFKAQIKPNRPSIKRDPFTPKSPITTDKNGVSNYFTLDDKPKNLYSKLHVRTVPTTIPSTIKKVIAPSVDKQTLTNKPTDRLMTLRPRHNRILSKHAKDSDTNSAKKSKRSSSTTKVFKRNGMKLRYRREPWSARMFDFFDAGIMEGLNYKLLNMREKRIGKAEACIDILGDSLRLHCNVLAMRTEPDGTRKAWVSWSPPNIIPDEWILESKVTSTRTVKIPSLEPSAKDYLKTILFS